MEILIFQLIFIALWGGLVYKIMYKSPQKNALFLSVAFFSMWYIHSMVNPDTFNDLPKYREVFNSIGITQWGRISNHWAAVDMELGYLYMNKLVYKLTSSFSVFLWIYSFIMLILYFRTIDKYSPYLVLSVLLVLLIPYNQSLFVIRQHMAVAIYFASIPLILERKLFSFLLVAILAFFIHRSSIIFIPVYFLYFFNGRRLVYVLLSFIVLFVVFWGSITVLSASFFDYGWFAQQAEGRTNISTFIQVLMFFLLYVFALGKSVFNIGINKLIFCILFLSLFFNGISIGLNIGRMAIYYNVISILSIPISLKYIKSTVVRSVISVTIVLLLFVQMIYGSNSQYYEKMELISFF
ncbi:MAG: EpsG family protein [Bacteroidales bacterium]|nr:EpsG family protein [Bacteroidales bacterium]